MMFGNISNRSAPIIAFNIDNLLYATSQPTGFINKLYSLFSTREVDYLFLEIVNNIWNRYDFSVYLITSSDDTELIYKVMDDNNVCFTDVVKYHGIDNLRRLVDTRFFLYVDSDEQILSQIGRKNAIHISNLTSYLPVSGGRI